MAEESGWANILDEDEQVLWQGRPAKPFVIRPSDLALSLFGAVFLAFSVFWMAMTLSMTGGDGGLWTLFPLFGLPFVAVGLYMVAGRFFYDAWVRRRTVYTLTDRRAMIAKSGLFGRSLKSWPIGAETRLELVEEGGAGTIWFAEQVTHHRRRRRSGGGNFTVRAGHGTSIRKIGFELIADAGRVYRLMRDVAQGQALQAGEAPA